MESAHGARAAPAALSHLGDLPMAAVGARPAAEIAGMAVEHGRAMVSADGAGLFIFEVASGLLKPLRLSGPLRRSRPVAPNEGAVGQAFQTGRPVSVPDYQRWRRALAGPKKQGIGSLVALPLVADGRALGVICVWSGRRRHFNPAHMEVLAAVAGQVAPLLHAAMLADQEQARARVFEALHELAVAAGGVRNPQELAHLAAERVGELLRADQVEVWRSSDSPERLERLAARLAAAPQAAASRLVERALRTRRAAWIRSSGGGAAGLAIPLSAGDRAVGAILVWTPAGRRFEPEDVHLLSLFAAQLAPVLQAAALVVERERQARAVAALRELAVAAGGVLEPKQLARLAVERAAALIGLDRAALYWWDRQSGQLVSLAASGPAGSKRLRPGQGVAGTAFERAAPILVEDYQAWEAATPWALRRGFRSALAVPLMLNDRAVGTVAAYSLKQRKFSRDDVALFSLLAAQVTPAVEAASLHAVLAGSEERFRSLYETMACGILVHDARGRVAEANRAAEEILGLRIQQMRGRHPDSLWRSRGEDGTESRPALVALETRRPVRDAVVRITRRDGQVRWVQVDSVPMLDGRGEARQVVSSLIDVSERRRAEAALRASEGRFRTVFDHAALGIARIGLDGAILEANPALAAMLGRPSSGLTRLGVADVVLEEDQDPEMYGRLASGDLEEFQAEMRCRRADGTFMWGRAVVTLVRGDGGEPAYVIAMVEDITEQKAQEEALAHRATHDPLTDLPNRTLLFDRLRHGIQLSQREAGSLALLMLDLDNFKDVNDSFASHQVGDTLLRAVADRLRAQLRASDTVARLGGDEFAIVLMAVDGGAGAAQAASKVLDAFEVPFEVAGRRLKIGASIGIAIYPEHGDDADSLMRVADTALYAAKRSGVGLATADPAGRVAGGASAVPTSPEPVPSL